jgi:signal peptidase II
VIILVTALATLVVDQLSKALIRVYMPMGESFSVSFIKIRQLRNPGTAFGIIQGKSWPLFLISIAVFVVLIVVLWHWGGPGSTLFQLGLGLIIGGALGNIIDRIILGEVVDFIDVGFWPVFNLADAAIVIGVGITLIVVITDIWKKEPGESGEST